MKQKGYSLIGKGLGTPALCLGALWVALWHGWARDCAGNWNSKHVFPYHWSSYLETSNSIATGKKSGLISTQPWWYGRGLRMVLHVRVQLSVSFLTFGKEKNGWVGFKIANLRISALRENKYGKFKTKRLAWQAIKTIFLDERCHVMLCHTVLRSDAFPACRRQNKHRDCSIQDRMGTWKWGNAGCYFEIKMDLLRFLYSETVQNHNFEYLWELICRNSITDMQKY